MIYSLDNIKIKEIDNIKIKEIVELLYRKDIVLINSAYDIRYRNMNYKEYRCARRIEGSINQMCHKCNFYI